MSKPKGSGISFEELSRIDRAIKRLKPKPATEASRAFDQICGDLFNSPNLSPSEAYHKLFASPEWASFRQELWEESKEEMQAKGLNPDDESDIIKHSLEVSKTPVRGIRKKKK